MMAFENWLKKALAVDIQAIQSVVESLSPKVSSSSRLAQYSSN